MEPDVDHAPHISARKARGAEIVLRKRWQLWTFVGGLIALVVLLFVLHIASLV
jgi:hypothetical protein